MSRQTLPHAYDNALAETTIGLFKTELFKPRGPWRTAEQVEIAVLEWHRDPSRTGGDQTASGGIFMQVAATGRVPSGRRHSVLLIQGTPTGTRRRRPRWSGSRVTS